MPMFARWSAGNRAATAATPAEWPARGVGGLLDHQRESGVEGKTHEDAESRPGLSRATKKTDAKKTTKKATTTKTASKKRRAKSCAGSRRPAAHWVTPVRRALTQADPVREVPAATDVLLLS